MVGSVCISTELQWNKILEIQLQISQIYLYALSKKVIEAICNNLILYQNSWNVYVIIIWKKILNSSVDNVKIFQCESLKHKIPVIKAQSSKELTSPISSLFFKMPCANSLSDQA